MPTSVFISSTSADLIKHRRAVREICLNSGYHILAMEHFGAMSKDATQACLDEVEKADIFIGIYAWRYGFVPSGSTISITEMEYNHAIQNQIPCLCFVLNQDHQTTQHFEEPLPSPQRLARFKTRILNNHVVDFFSTPQDLGLKVSSSLNRFSQNQPHTPKQQTPKQEPDASSGMTFNGNNTFNGGTFAARDNFINSHKGEKDE